MRFSTARVVEECNVYDDDEKTYVRLRKRNYLFRDLTVHSKGRVIPRERSMVMGYEIRDENRDKVAIICPEEFNKLVTEGKVVLIEYA